MYQSNYFIVHM